MEEMRREPGAYHEEPTRSHACWPDYAQGGSDPDGGIVVPLLPIKRRVSEALPCRKPTSPVDCIVSGLQRPTALQARSRYVRSASWAPRRQIRASQRSNVCEKTGSSARSP